MEGRLDGLCGPFDDWFDGEDDEFDDLFIISIDRVVELGIVA